MQYIETVFASKNEIFHWKNLDIFLIFAQKIDCGYTLEPPRRGGSNGYPQSMFWSKNKKNRYTLHSPVLLYKSGGLRRYSLHGHVFLMDNEMDSQIVSSYVIDPLQTDDYTLLIFKEIRITAIIIVICFRFYTNVDTIVILGYI